MYFTTEWVWLMIKEALKSTMRTDSLITFHKIGMFLFYLQIAAELDSLRLVLDGKDKEIEVLQDRIK